MIKAVYLSIHSEWERDLSARDFYEFLTYVMGFVPQMVFGQWNRAQYKALLTEVKRQLHAFLTEELIEDFDHQPEWEKKDEESEKKSDKQTTSSPQRTGTAIQLRLFFIKVSSAIIRFFKRAVLWHIEALEAILYTLIDRFKRKPMQENSDENRYRY